MPFSLRLGELAQQDLILKQDMGRLLSCQFVGSDFSAEDVVVNLLAIEAAFGLNRYGDGLYQKMYRSGKRSSSTTRDTRGEASYLKSLVDNVAGGGFESGPSIKVDLNQRLIDGAKRMAAALYLKIKEVPVEVMAERRQRHVDLHWLEKRGFSSRETDLIRTRRREIFREWGLCFPVILWPPVQEYFDEIEKGLSRSYRILSSLDLQFCGEREFEDMVRRIYAWEGIPDSLIDMKIEGMSPYPLKVRMMTVEFPDPRLERRRRGSGHISGTVKYLKEDFRRAYAGRVENYFRDIIMHMGDNFDHNLHILKVFDDLRVSTPCRVEGIGSSCIQD